MLSFTVPYLVAASLRKNQIRCQKGQENTLVHVLQKQYNQGIGLVQWFDLLVTLGVKTVYCDVILFRKSRLR